MKNFDINEIRKDFPALNDYVYLNSSSISLMPMPVQNALQEFSQKINYAGTVSFDEEAEIGSVEDTRTEFAKFLNCSEENLAIISSATEGLCQVAWALKPKGNIVVIDIEFPSGVTAWRRVAKETGAELRFINIADRPADLMLEEVIDNIDDETSIVCLSHAQYSNGLVLDIHALAEACHAKNARCIIDAVQSAGIVPIDLSDSKVDALIIGGYKWLCGPFGAAALYVSDELKEVIEPTFVGWRSMINPYNFDATRYEYNTGMRGFEYSTMSYAAGFALGQSVKYINELGIEQVRKQALKVSNYLMEQLDDMGAEILSPREEHRRTGTVFTRFPGFDGEKIAHELNRNNVIVSPRFSGTRFSCHFFNNEEDIDKAMEVLKRVKSGVLVK